MFVMKKLFIFLLCLYGVMVSAQDCDNEQLKTLPGKWLPQPGDAVGGNYKNPTAAEIAGAKKIVNQIKQLFQEQYQPVGMDTYHHYHFLADESTDKNIYGNSSIYTIRNFLFHCVKGRKETSDEGLGSYVHINPVNFVKFSSIPVYDEYGKVNSTFGFHELTPSQMVNGKQLLDFSDGYHIIEGTSSYQVWITYEGKKPFRYVSRREFLEKQVAICEANLNALHQHYSSKGWKDNLAMFPQYKEKMLEDEKNHLSMYENPLRAYRQDLENDAGWLNEMAVVKQESVSGVYRYVFTTVDDPYMSAVPIMPNPD